MEGRFLGSTKHSETILVVDDEPTVSMLLSAVLRTSGYNVLVADCGEDALGQARGYKDTIHLLLTDFRMPGMTGLELAATLIEERPQMRVMIMSGYAVEMFAVKAECYALQKPFLPSHLRATVAHVLAGKPGPPDGSRGAKASV